MAELLLTLGYFVVVEPGSVGLEFGPGGAAGGVVDWLVTAGGLDTVERSRETQKKPPIIKATTMIKAIHNALDKLLAVRKASDLLS